MEIITDYGRIDIAAEWSDAGVRSGEIVAQDMMPVRTGPNFRPIVGVRF